MKKNNNKITLSRSTHATSAQADENALALLLTKQRQEGKEIHFHCQNQHTPEAFHYSFHRDVPVIKRVGSGYMSTVSSIETTRMVKMKVAAKFLYENEQIEATFTSGYLSVLQQQREL